MMFDMNSFLWGCLTIDIVYTLTFTIAGYHYRKKA
jgi:hypothetical protein